MTNLSHWKLYVFEKLPPSLTALFFNLKESKSIKFLPTYMQIVLRNYIQNYKTIYLFFTIKKIIYFNYFFCIENFPRINFFIFRIEVNKLN